ncbi:Cell surface mannoprotein mp65 [Coniothyrium glycines]
MKSLVLASALAAAGLLAGTASSHPLDLKRDLTTEVVIVTTTVADVVVYVDESGVPYSTTTQAKSSDAATSVVVPSTTSEVFESSAISASVSEAAPTSATPLASTSDLPSSTVVTAAPEPTAVEVKDSSVPITEAQTSSPPSTPTEEPVPTTTSAAAPSATKESVSGRNFPIGVTYDPFEGPQDQAKCKSSQQIADEFSKMKDYKIVRIYGMGCDIIPLAVQNAVKNGQQIMAGAYMSTRASGEDLSTVIQILKDAVDQHNGGNWDVIQLFSVENERVNDHDMTASAVVDAIQRGREQLRSLGYTGPVSAVDTVPATVDNPAICKNSDVVTVNCHAFFDSNSKAEDAGTFVKSQIEQVKKACGTNRVVITESGWPHQGNANGVAVPSLDDQQLALKSLRDNFSSDLFFFNAFDSTWKSNWAGSFNAEQYWGIIQ